jgi:uncharacterized protein
MPTYYRRPGVYLEESLLVNPSDVAGTFTVAAFVGAAEKGPVNEPVLVESWSDYVTVFGGLNPITQPALPDPNDVTSRISAPIPADLTALKAHATYGDTKYATPFGGAAFTAGQYVKLGDASKAHFTPHTVAGVWVVNAFPGTPAPIPVTPKVLSYLPFSVYSFFQNGGRVAWIIRATPTAAPDKGTASSITVNGSNTGIANLTSFVLKARSPGLWGNTIKYALATQSTVGAGATAENVFALQILLRNVEGNDEVVETFPSLSIKGEIPGTRRIDSVINDSVSGSLYVSVSGVNEQQPQPVVTTEPVSLAGGVDPSIPDSGDLQDAAQVVTKVEGPIALNIVGYLNDASKADTVEFSNAWVGTTIPSTYFTDRQDIFVVNDSAPPRNPGTSSSVYKTQIQTALGANTGDSYSASYGPWLIIPNPSRVGTTVSVPPGGAVVGMMARIDATIGVFRAPAGVIAGLSNAVGVQTKFTDIELGDLNSQNINIVRSVVGSGICVMGGRTRKTYGADRYVSARRTLIYLKEVLKRSTQFAVFENNDQRLWSALRMSAERLLRPLWEAGGLRGANSAEAYYITCDDTINTPAVIQSGEVRMEVGVALEYPAEFVVIRITQFDRGTFTAEVQPVG